MTPWQSIDPPADRPVGAYRDSRLDQDVRTSRTVDVPADLADHWTPEAGSSLRSYHQYEGKPIRPSEIVEVVSLGDSGDRRDPGPLRFQYVVTVRGRMIRKDRSLSHLRASRVFSEADLDRLPESASALLTGKADLIHGLLTAAHDAAVEALPERVVDVG